MGLDILGESARGEGLTLVAMMDSFAFLAKAEAILRPCALIEATARIII